MKFLSFKILMLGILLPPILYIFTVQFLIQKLYMDGYLNEKYTKEIQNIYIGDPQELFEGSARLKTVISRNINRYLKNKVLLKWGAKANVRVLTRQGTILYPEVFEGYGANTPAEIAAENYKFMNEGLVVSTDLHINHNTLISNIILAFYILLFLLMSYLYYRSGVRKVIKEERKKSNEINRLKGLEKTHTDRLASLIQEREKIASDVEKMKKTLEKEKDKASKNEEEMIEEFVTLEEKMKKNLELQNEQKAEIEELKEKIKKFEKTKKDGRPSDMVSKRFKTLYKNVSVHDRAISGYLELEEDMRIKSEEIIHQLNDDPGLVTIKRKVFGKKNRETVLEVLFAYKGRLYFRKTKDNRIEVLTIGTKNTQTKDLEFLDNL